MLPPFPLTLIAFLPLLSAHPLSPTTLNTTTIPPSISPTNLSLPHDPTSLLSKGYHISFLDFRPPPIPYRHASTLLSEATTYLSALEASYPDYSIDRTPIRGQAFLYGDPGTGVSFAVWKAPGSGAGMDDTVGRNGTGGVGGGGKEERGRGGEMGVEAGEGAGVEPLVFRAVEAALATASEFVRGFGKENRIWSCRIEVRRQNAIGGGYGGVIADGGLVGDGAVVGFEGVA